MTIGIYKLWFENTVDKVYIGKSVNIESRYTQHKRALKDSTHHNYKLQYSYNNYNTYPLMSIVQSTQNILELGNLEKYWCEYYTVFTTGFNIAPIDTNSSLSILEPCNNIKHEEQVYSEALELLAYTKLTYKEIGNILNISDRIVFSIRYLYAHRYLSMKYPDVVKDMLANRKKPDKAVISPKGELYIIPFGKGQQFARDNNLPIPSFNNILSGHSKEYKGWKLWSS